LQILEDNNKYLEKLRKELRLEKDKEEKSLRDQMKVNLEYENNSKSASNRIDFYLVQLKMIYAIVSHVKNAN